VRIILYSLKNGKKNYASTTGKLDNSEVRSVFFICKPLANDVM